MHHCFAKQSKSLYFMTYSKILSGAILSLLSLTTLSAQTTRQANYSIDTIYYHFVNGVQMMEIDYASHWETNARDYAMSQINLNTLQSYPIPKPLNPYIFRNKQGAIIKQYNTRELIYQSSDFRPVESLTNEMVHHTSRRVQSNEGYLAILSNTDERKDLHRYLIQSNQGGYGVIDSTGNVLLEPLYLGILDVNEAYQLTTQDGKIQIADLNFRVLSQPVYDELRYAGKGIFFVKRDNYWGAINKHGKIVMPIQFSYLPDNFHNGYARALIDDPDKGRSVGYVDSNYQVVGSIKYQEVSIFEEGLGGVQLNDKWGFINTKGVLVIPCQYDYTQSFANGYAVVRNGDYNSDDLAFGLINTRGKVIIPTIYTYIEDPSEGLINVCKDRNCGYINLKNQIIIPLEYSNVWPFRDGKAKVWKDGETFYINAKGERVSD